MTHKAKPGAAPAAPRFKAFPPSQWSINDLVSTLGFGRWQRGGRVRYRLFTWPPDVFAMSAVILRSSGAYLNAVRPHSYRARCPYQLKGWSDRIDRVAEEWRRQVEPRKPPKMVMELLDVVGQHARDGLTLSDLGRPSEENLDWLPYLRLLAMADQTCRGIGIFFGAAECLVAEQEKGHALTLDQLTYPADSFVLSLAMYRLHAQIKARDKLKPTEGFRPITLCRRVDPARAVVLPKMRTSQRGATIRSFSHHLCLLEGSDVEPVWIPTTTKLLSNAVRARVGKQLEPDEIARNAGPYNLVLFPWPLSLLPTQFEPRPNKLACLAGRPHDGNCFFSFRHAPTPPRFHAQIGQLIAEARKIVGPVHGIVLPEMALTRRQFESVFDKLNDHELEFIACGVYEPPTRRAPLGRNYAIVRRRLSRKTHMNVVQEKHHRWALDPNQINQYSLGSTLRPDNVWWEGITLPRRSLHFFALDPFCAFTVLICEDLARPDPVADAIRAMGPNLVICLLLDGPQLATRWSARYATVLADDPGSSVLTLSSLGMVTLSRVRDRLHESSRVVALWRDSAGAPTELRLPEGAHALVISLTAEPRTEYTIDGRPDRGMAASLRLAGVHPLRFEDRSGPEAAARRKRATRRRKK